ncbi:MAG: glycosyltransferase family 39 protein [Bacteroidota bacterium]
MWNRRQSLLILLAILAVGLVVRTHNLTDLGLWQDERLPVLAARGLLYEIPESTTEPTFTADLYLQHDNYSRLREAALWGEGSNTMFYLIVLRSWTQIFGFSDLSLRLMQVLLGLATIALLYAFMSRLTGSRRWGLLAAALAAAHPTMVQYSMELRSYDLGAFMTLLGTYLFLLLYVRPDESAGPRRHFLLLGFYFVVAFASLMTHYFTVFVYGGHFIYMLVFHRPWKVLLPYLGVVVAVFGGLYIWLVPLGGSEGFKMIEHRNKKWAEMMESLKDDADNAVIRPATPLYLMGGLSQSLTSLGGVGFQGRGWRIREFFPLLLIPVILLLTGLLSRANPLRWRVLLGGLCLLLPFMYVVMAIRAGHTMSFNPTYNMLNVAFVVGLMVLAARAAMHTPRTAVRIALVVLLLAQTGIMYFSAHPRNAHFMSSPNQYVAAAEAVKASYQPGEVVVWADWYTAQLANLYLRDRTDILQSVATPPTQKVFIRNISGDDRIVATIQDEWHKLPQE